MDGDRRDKQRVLIAGGGVAGIEAALALRDLAGERVEVEVCDPRREFVFKPFAVGEPYGVPRSFRYEMGDLVARCGASLRPSRLVSVDPRLRHAIADDGERVAYDHLIVATGVEMRWAVPGAATFWGVVDEGQVGEVFDGLRSGEVRHLVLTMPGGHSWALPLYELALLGASLLSRYNGHGEARITVVTPEDTPLEVFGRGAAERAAKLMEEHGIEVIAGAHPKRFEGERLRIAPGGEIEADAVICLPRLEGRRIDGIPHDSDGFVGVDEFGGVIGLEHAYATGDVTAFPVKQSGIAAQQADTVAEAIAAAAGAGARPRPFDPVLFGVLWIGREPRYIYGRPTGGHGETSSLSRQPPPMLRDNKPTARYMTPLVDALIAEGHQNSSSSSGTARIPSAS